MEPELKPELNKVLNAINEIESFFSDRPKDFIAFHTDLRVKRAVERNIEIIGDGLTKLLHQHTSLRLYNSEKIVNIIDQVIYRFDAASDEIIWQMVVKDLPVIKAEIEGLLEE